MRNEPTKSLAQRRGDRLNPIRPGPLLWPVFKCRCLAAFQVSIEVRSQLPQRSASPKPTEIPRKARTGYLGIGSMFRTADLRGEGCSAPLPSGFGSYSEHLKKARHPGPAVCPHLAKTERKSGWPSFRTRRGSGVAPLRLPARSPNLNAYAERFVLSIKSECLDKIVPLGERHLRHAIKEYAEHYHWERHHQGLDSSIITSDGPTRINGPIQRRARLGGMLNHYYREAA